MNRIVATMDDLPELPFEKVLSYLNLEDRLKARAVSRRWYHWINCFRVKTLCYSQRPAGFIWGKSRWVSGAFAQNFISSTRFASFFGQTILSSLKHLRLCDFDLSRDETAFARLNSFGQLEQLDIIWVEFNKQDVFNLHLPMLTSLQLENVRGIRKLTLKAPTLREVRILDRSLLSVEIVHGESVERLLIDCWEYTDVKKLKNLRYLYVDDHEGIDSTFLSSLQQLKEIHTNQPKDVSKLFEQKQRSGRADLKIYLCGLLLNGSDDPAINVLGDSGTFYLRGESLLCLAENPSRLADEILFYRSFDYSHIELVASSLEVDLLKRFTRLTNIAADYPVQNIERFLELLKNCENIIDLVFNGDQPQDLFDRLPEHCAIQGFLYRSPPNLYTSPPDLDFLFRLKHLIYLDIDWSIDSETVRRAYDELPVLSCFSFRYGQKKASIRIGQSRQFQVEVGYKKKTVSDLNAAIEFITGNGGIEPQGQRSKRSKVVACSSVH